jgi:hypothetical protein
VAVAVDAINLQCIVCSTIRSDTWDDEIDFCFVFSSLCFSLAVNPLHDGELSEYAYRDKIVNPLIENVFLDINEMIRMKT